MARRRPPSEPADAEEQRLVDQLARAEDMARRLQLVVAGETDDMYGDRAAWLRGRLEELRRRRREAEPDGA